MNKEEPIIINSTQQEIIRDFWATIRRSCNNLRDGVIRPLDGSFAADKLSTLLEDIIAVCQKHGGTLTMLAGIKKPSELTNDKAETEMDQYLIALIEAEINLETHRSSHFGNFIGDFYQQFTDDLLSVSTKLSVQIFPKFTFDIS